MTDRPVILLYDDDPELCALLADLLEATGFAVIATTGVMHPAALQLRHAPDCLILDLMLNNSLSGIEIAQGFREKRVPFPIIAVSASRQQATMARAYGLYDADTGKGLFDLVLEKPDDIGLSQLAMALERLGIRPSTTRHES